MPLLGKIRFKAQPSPDNLDPNDEIYVCKATGEVFKDYEKFFDQTILCNSLIWTCEVTGHSNLTFSEALESEQNSRKQINSFPKTLHLPILHLASLTKRTIFKDLLDDVYNFAKDRYFIGEQVVVTTETEKKHAVVIKVFPVINLSRTTNEKSNFITEQEVGSDGKKRIIIRSPKKTIIDSSLFQYMSQDIKNGTTVMSTAKNMSRNKNHFNRETCRLFLKEHCDHQGKEAWKLKDSIMKKYNLSSVKFNEYFAGPIPNFPGSDDVFTDVSNGDIKKMMEKKDSTILNAQKKEQDRRQAERDWLKQRDDMLCDDLLDLPIPTPLGMSGDDFGNSIMVMEFLNSFKTLCELELPGSFNIVSLIECLYEQHSSTLYLDIVQQLMSAIFKMQSGLPELNLSWKAACKYDADIQDRMPLIKIYQSINSVKKSKSNKSQPFLETPLKHLPLDTSSLTEVVRLHLLVGCDVLCSQSDGSMEVKMEHKASEFSQTHPEVMKKLNDGHLLDLEPSEKLKLLSCLIDQILCLPTCRDLIEENYNKLKAAQKDLRTHLYAVQRRERDFINYNMKKKQEEEESMKLSKKNNKSSLQRDTNNNNNNNGSNSNIKKKSSILDLKDKDFEDMPVEGIDWDQLSQEEKDHIKKWSTRRLLELQTLVDNLQSECFLLPIGCDRTYRRYWLFRSIPGLLFVEDSRAQSWTVPQCFMSPVKQDEARIQAALNSSTTVVDKSKSADDLTDRKPFNTIDKYFTSDSVVKKEVVDTGKFPTNILDITSASSDVKDVKMITTPSTLPTSDDAVVAATGVTYMSVHEQLKVKGTIEWSVFNEPEQLDALIQRLNKRGHREGSLRNYLTHNREKIFSNLTNAEFTFQFLTSELSTKRGDKNSFAENHHGTDINGQPIVLNGSSSPNGVRQKLNLSKGKATSVIDKFGGVAGELELMKVIGDMLLDLEERIFAGSLGQLKNIDREAWKKGLECTDEQFNGGRLYSSTNGQPQATLNANILHDDDVDVDDAQLRFNKKMLKKISQMMVNVQQMLEMKYLIPPLGEDEEARMKRLKALELEQVKLSNDGGLYGDGCDVTTNDIIDNAVNVNNNNKNNDDDDGGNANNTTQLPMEADLRGETKNAKNVPITDCPPNVSGGNINNENIYTTLSSNNKIDVLNGGCSKDKIFNDAPTNRNSSDYDNTNQNCIDTTTTTTTTTTSIDVSFNNNNDSNLNDNVNENGSNKDMTNNDSDTATNIIENVVANISYNGTANNSNIGAVNNSNGASNSNGTATNNNNNNNSGTATKNNNNNDNGTATSNNNNDTATNNNNNNNGTATNSSNGNNNTNLSRWHKCVQDCSNFSQLYLCVCLLDASIAWSKSALNARCKLCRKKKDAEFMLLCDSCDQGHHMYCLKPPLKKVPEGDWYCPACRPKELLPVVVATTNSRKVTKNAKFKSLDESDLEEEDDDDEDDDNKDVNKKIHACGIIDDGGGDDDDYEKDGGNDNDDGDSLDNSITRNDSTQFLELGQSVKEDNKAIGKNPNKKCKFKKTTTSSSNSSKSRNSTSSLYSTTTSTTATTTTAVAATTSTSSPLSSSSVTTNKISPPSGKSTRSGREIKQKNDDEFIINRPKVKERKRNRTSLLPGEGDEVRTNRREKSKRHSSKAPKYSDDFDYASGNYVCDENENEADGDGNAYGNGNSNSSIVGDGEEYYEERKVKRSGGGGNGGGGGGNDDGGNDNDDDDDDDDDDYGVKKRKGRKRKKLDVAQVFNEEKNRKKKKTRRHSPSLLLSSSLSSSSTTSLKSNHRQTNPSMKMIEDIVGEMMKDDNAWPFLKPVTVKDAPDYFDIIEQPMDLSTIKYKIYRFEYADEQAIIDDLRLMFDNCNLYNSPNTPVHDAGLALEKFLDERLQQITKNGPSRSINSVANGNGPSSSSSKYYSSTKRMSL